MSTGRDRRDPSAMADRDTKLLVIVGPTATGKTELAIRLAKRYGGEVVSGDSMQVYRGLDIGTAKPDQAERQGVPHHLLDVADPTERFTVAAFQRLAQAAIADIAGRGRLPILAGGTGLYIRAVVQNYILSPAAPDWQRRADVAASLGSDGPALHRTLAAVDPETAARLHPHDVPRLQRALEVYARTGGSIRRWEGKGPALYDALVLGLTMDRASLYRIIEERVDRMLAQGWLDEVRRLVSAYGADAPALQGLGYRQLLPVVTGSRPLAEASALIKQETRRLAKRQWTWFKREPGIRWIDMGDTRDIEKAWTAAIQYVEGKWPSL